MQALSKRISNEENTLSQYSSRIRTAYRLLLNSHNHILDILEQRTGSNSSSEVLAKGYAMLFKEGKRIRHADEMEPGDIIKIVVSSEEFLQQ